MSILLNNKILNMSIISWAAAQIIKTLLVLITSKKLDLERLFGSGGMPSSHTSFVCALTIGVLRTDGFTSSLFAACFVLSAVVMYDATGVRRQAGEHAKLLNNIANTLFSKEHQNPTKTYEALKEYLGHTPKEVFAGAVLGIFVGWIYPI